jgi:hypothetical protein
MEVASLMPGDLVSRASVESVIVLSTELGQDQNMGAARPCVLLLPSLAHPPTLHHLILAVSCLAGSLGHEFLCKHK